MLSDQIQRVIGPFKEFGGFAGTLYILDRLLSSLSPQLRLQFYEMMVQPIPDQPIIGGRFANSIDIRRIEPGAPEIELMPARKDIIISRFAQGAICLGGYTKGHLIGYIWLSFNSYEEDEIRCTYVLEDHAHSVFDFDLYILPEHRMGIGFIGLWNGTNKYLREQGIRYTFSRLTRYNTPSRKSHAHLGWKCVARVFSLKMWCLEIIIAGIFPYFSISFNRNSRVQLTLSPRALGFQHE